jgi:hypothetical protein
MEVLESAFAESADGVASAGVAPFSVLPALCAFSHPSKWERKDGDANNSPVPLFFEHKQKDELNAA